MSKRRLIKDQFQELKGTGFMQMKPKKKSSNEDLDDDDDIQIPTNEEMGIDDITQKLIKAKLENLEARTKSIQEKTTSIKRELWNQWTTTFMDKFEEAFGIFKGSIVNLHLNKEQVATLEAEFDKAIQKLEKTVTKMVKEAKVSDDEDNE